MSEQPPKPRAAKPPRQRWHPPGYTKEDIRAVQALEMYARGARQEPPSQRDCQIALDYIINTAAGTYDEPFMAGHPDVVNYLVGRRSVGLAIVKLMKLKPEILDE